MKTLRMVTAVAALAILAGVAYVNQATETAGTKMAEAGEKFVGTLTDDQKTKTVLGFDVEERFNWEFIPLQDNKTKKSTRKGLGLEEMSKEQKAAALALIKAGTSSDGYAAATTIMSLEAILRDLEKGGAMIRNPDWYFFTVFGKPSKTGKWGWRVEGHHLSLNFMIDKGAVVSSTPAFFGANPANVMGGDLKGKRTIPECDDLARELFNSFDDGQKKAVLQEKHLPEPGAKTTAPKLGDPIGLAGAKMNDKQKAVLQKLIDSYAKRMAPDVAQAQLAEVKDAGLDKVYFAFTGSTEAGKARTYRVHGPTFVIEFLNTQADSANNPANHIHSAWRNSKGDFGVTK
jgi:hypothetical protein